MSGRCHFFRGAVAFCFSISLWAAPTVAPKLAAPLEVNAGELLWSELNCATCHKGSPVEGRVGGRAGPMLGAEGVKVTPQFLRAFVENPSREKPGTTMPDLLGAERAEAVDALTHFLAPTGEEEKGVGSSATKMAQGRKLFHMVGCVACHAPQESWQAVMGSDPKAEIDPALLGTNSVPLGNLATKYSVPELTRFLLDPLKFRKSGRMPALNLADGEAQAIAMYLLRAQADDPNSPRSTPKTLAGLQYDYFEAGFDGEPNWDALKPLSSGTVETFSVQGRRRDQQFGFRFSGVITIPQDGKYSFWLRSDDGARLWIDDKMVVDNGGDHAAEEKNGSVELKAGLHPITLTFYNNGAGYELQVRWQPPGGRRQEIPPNLFAHLGQPMLPLGGGTFVRDTAKAARGKAMFASLGCASCHEHSEVKFSSLAVKTYSEMGPSGGCLADDVKSALPNYHLDSAQRTALRNLLANKTARALAPSAEAHVWNTVAALNCVACHTREAKGGPIDARLQYFFARGDADLGDEGRIPPHLTGVGKKLRAEWMSEVLLKGAKVRPYMETRMPQFGAGQVGHLPALLEKADGFVAGSEAHATVRDEKFGRRLVGTGGLSCVSCHEFAGHKSLGIPAMDLAYMTKRLKREWFGRYVIDPPSLRPGTRMPSFWPNGEAANKDVLEGKTDAQISAIWAYLALGRHADLPPGLVQGKKEIIADKEAVIYRNFIEGAGARAIGVGYSEKANLAFDANAVRIAEIWQGAFIDGARHASGRGEGFEKPLGDRIYKLPPGPAVAELRDSSSAWPTESDLQMRGYNLDGKRRPAFRYRVGEIEVRDFPEARQGELDSYFTRKIEVTGKLGATAWFRAAVGDKIEPQGDGSFVVDGKVTIKLTPKGSVRQSNGKAELVTSLMISNSGGTITEEIRW